MFESLAAWVLNMYIGEYLENLNTDQLSIDLLQGQIELENVPFKKTALSKLNAAIRLRSGNLGKLTLTVPLTRWRSEPWVVKLSDINVVLEPNLNKESDKANDGNEGSDEENIKFKPFEDQDEVDGLSASKDAQSSSWWGYAAVSSIVENIQLIMTNVHIRYVDETSIPGQSFACGIEIERFTAQATDSHWKPGFVVRVADETSYKLFQFFGLNFYWDNSFNAQVPTTIEPRGRFLSEASLDIRLEKKFSINSDDQETKQTCFNVFTKFATALKLKFDQIQLENIKLAVQNVTKWYFGEVDESIDQGVVKFKPKVDVGVSGTASEVVAIATFDVPAINLELKNCLGESDGQPFVLCQGESLILKYVKEKIHISHIEASFGSIRIKDLLETTTTTSSNLQYLLSTTNGWEGKFLDNQSYLSSSCPEMANFDDSDFILLSSSLPGALSPGFRGKATQFSTAPVTPKLSRKTSLRADPLARIRITFIDAIHKDLESKFNKVQCQIEADFGNLEVVVNQETWVLLFDFFGLLTPPLDDLKGDESDEVKRQINVKAETLTVLLNIPKERRLLAKMMANDFRATVLTEKAGVEIFGKICGFVVEDCSSHLYAEKINIRASEKDLEFVVYKYTKPDFDLKREFDAVLSLTSTEKCTYVHSQRFLTEFTSFWLQYVQLQEYYNRARAASLGMMFDEKLSRGFRLKLTANFNQTVVILPECSTSPKSLIVETNLLSINNYFRFANSQESAKFYDETDDFSCLQDVMEIKLHDSGLFVGSLSLTDNEWNNRPVSKISENLLDKFYSTDVTFVRNLDSSISRNVPDMEIHIKINNLACKLHLNTYKIIRNLLEKNLGEDIPQTANVQSQFRSNPATMTILSGLIWRNILLTVDLNDVTFALCQPLQLNRTTNCDERVDNFGRINIGRAHFSFESFSDLTKEVDFVCYSGSLIDTRYENEAANKRNNVFSTIFSNISDSPDTSPTSKEAKNDNVVAEIHFYSHKETSKFTLLFRLAQLVVVSDWLLMAKAFLLSRCDSYAKAKPRKFSLTPGSLIRSGVATRKSFEEEKMKADNFEMKINLTDSELIFIENTSCRNSLATVLKGTSVMNYKEHEFSTKFSCNANSLQIFNCTMANRRDTETTLTEPFSLTIELAPLPKKGPSVKLVPVGLLDLGPIHVDHKIEVNLCNVVAKFSYRDWLVFKSVLDAYALVFASDSTSTSPNSRSISLEKIETKIASGCLWLLDDSQDHRMPLLRVTMKNAEFEQKPTKLRGESKEGSGFLHFSVDFFNQNVYGWEPLLEPFRLQHLSWNYFPRINSLDFGVYCTHETLNLNVSRVFLDQSSHFLARWATVSQAVSTDFRTSYLRRSDFLPYVLRNECGSRLKFTVETAKLQKDKSKSVKIDWIIVEPDESASFSFHSLPQIDDNSNSLGVDKIVVRIDGWHEIGAITVDSVGTYFRLTRLNEQNKNVSGLNSPTPTFAHVVVAVTKDNEGKKIITIRSSLLFVNALSEPLEVYLENISTFLGDHFAFVLQPGAVRPAPLMFTVCRIAVRPKGVWSVGFCKPISWQHVTSPGQVSDCFRQCTAQEKALYKLCVSIKREHFPDAKRYSELNLSNIVTLPGHTVTFAPPLIVVNLLPIDAKLKIKPLDNEYNIIAGDRQSITAVDVRDQIELSFSIDNFYARETLKLMPAKIQEEKNFDVEMFDINRRPFILNVFAIPIKGGGIKISMSSPFWIVNKSGLPLIFKQESSSEEAAGQFDEHESGKSMFPAIFSFADIGSPKRLCLRLGHFTQHNCKPLWCNSFVLDPGITCKTLQLQKYDNSPSLLYNIGVEVRVGQGLYKDTGIVMLTALYTLDNRSSHKLYVSQKCDVDGKQVSSTISPNCSMAWHWSRQDLDMLLCVKRFDLPHWSNGFRIDQLTSFHLTIRDEKEMPHLLRVEIVLHGAMYFVTFLDADTFPPPIRIENLSEVPILYQQKGCDAGHLRTILRPHSEVNYSWDDQLQPKLMVLTIYGNKSIEYDMTILGQHCPLTYENYFYIAFTTTFDKNLNRLGDEMELVLDVLPKGKVILNKKNSTSTTQLWRMTVDGMLVNVGMQRSERDNHSDSSVLDILNLPDPKNCVPLMLHRPDHRRRLTQRWNFTEDGRLTCGLQALYVQAADRQLKSNVAAVLGPTASAAHLNADYPAEQFICKQRQKPGSGSLLVTVSLDGPTRVLRITDVTNSVRELTPKKQKYLENVVACDSIGFQFSCTFNLEALAFSVITSKYEELLYCKMHGFLLQFGKEGRRYRLSTTILDLQADNQLVNADRWTLLYIRPKYDEKGEANTPAVNVHVSWTSLPSYDSFESFVVCIGKVALFLDEIFLWKLVMFLELDVPSSVSQTLHNSLSIGYKPPNIDIERPDPQKARRCYFDNLSLSCRRLYLSVLTANMLPGELRRAKQRWNVPLVRFENAPVEIEPFQQMYYFETLNFLLDAFGKHLQQQLTSQAVKILGTVDFLGNPLGLFQDLSGGLRELFIEGSVTGFVRGVWHGVSSSTAKITSSVSDGVGKISMDEKHRQIREAVRQSQTNSADPLGHLMTGVKGLGIGILGGIFSVPSNVYDGVRKDGLEGLLIGAGKGVVGVVTKPVQGVLDLATGAATAAKEIVGSSGPPTAKFPSCRLRPSRVTRSVQGTLPPYSSSLASGQEALRVIRDHNNEICLAMYLINSASNGETLYVLVSSELVYVVKKRSTDDQEVVLTVKYSELMNCSTVTQPGTGSVDVVYLEFLSNSIGSYNKNGKPKKSLVRCNSFDIAFELSRQIMHAKQQFDDLQRSLPIPEDVSVEF